ncbi:MAG TPA: acyltransferase [Acidobacteriaceae bacterium]|nr:acyltransferase [Acidobacteriaceae bacterium]
MSKAHRMQPFELIRRREIPSRKIGNRSKAEESKNSFVEGANGRLKAAEPNHKPELDGIRGIALIAVMMSHSGPFILNNSLFSKVLVYAMIPGWSGVELFFVLSGYLITGILLRSKTAQNYFSSFYMRRVLRIFPIYYMVLTVGFFVASHNAWWNYLMPHLAETRVAYFFYLQNWPVFWNHGLVQNPNAFGHFWSLAVEEQFYVVWPLIIFFLPEKLVLWICTGGLLMALPFRIFMVHRFAEDFTAMTLTTSRIDGLLIGAIVAILLRKGPIQLRGIYIALGLGAAIIGYIALFHHRELLGTYFYMPTIGITGFSLLAGGLLALSQHQIGWLRWILTAKWLRVVGRYSYGMYIYHIPVFAICGRVLTAHLHQVSPMPVRFAVPYITCLFCITFLIAKLSYDYFESNFLSLKVFFNVRQRPQPGERAGWAKRVALGDSGAAE